MASFGQYPPLPLSQNQPPPLPEVPQQPGNQYSSNWGYGGADGSMVPHQFPNVAAQNYLQVQPNSSFHHVGYAPQQPPHHQQEYQPQQPQQYSSYPPPPPPPDSSYPPPPPPPPSGPVPPIYFPSSQYNQYSHQPLQSSLPPPPPSSPPPSSSIPPPPPPSSPPPSSSLPPVSKSKDIGLNGRSRQKNDQERRKELSAPGKRESRNLNQGHPSNVPKPPVPKYNVPSGRVELEEERRLKKREMEKHKQEEKHRQLKESQNNVLHKSQILPSGMKGHGSIFGSRIGERTSSTPLLSGERTENRFKKPTTFLCRMK